MCTFFKLPIHYVHNNYIVGVDLENIAGGSDIKVYCKFGGATTPNSD